MNGVLCCWLHDVLCCTTMVGAGAAGAATGGGGGYAARAMPAGPFTWAAGGMAN